MIFSRAMITVALASVAHVGAAQVVNHEAAGNLESLNNIGCVAHAEVRNTFSPADLYRATAECIRKNDYDRAVYLSAVAGVYARFDAMRVLDPSATAAQDAVRSKYMGHLSDSQQRRFFKRLSETASDDGALEAICRNIRQLGAPAYYPNYMIQHGMRAFSPTAGKSLKDDFDAASAWQESLVAFLHCP